VTTRLATGAFDRAWHALAPEDVLATMDASSDGLSSADVARRLTQYGPNVLEVTPPEPAWRIFFRQLASVVTALLVAAVVFSIGVGDHADALAIAVVLALNVGIGFVMELRARRAVEALRSLDVQRATVLRDGAVVDVDARDLVPGDVVVLEAGRSVPADARIVDDAELRVTESLLTGESEPVTKQAHATIPETTALAERVTMAYKGTAVVAGSGRAVVIATGASTELGRIGTLMGSVEEERTPLERRLDVLGRRLAVGAIAIGALVVMLNVAEGRSITQLLLIGIAVAVAAVPEGLPAVVTIAMARGVRRMARRHALIRRLPMVETLGSATVVCTDKTGTLTRGEMTVTTVWTADGDDDATRGTEIAIDGIGYDPRGSLSVANAPVQVDGSRGLRALLQAGVLANRAGLARGDDGAWTIRGDPTEAALLVLAKKAEIDADALTEAMPEVAELPFSSERMLMATFHRVGDHVVAFAKGAPGRLLARCGRIITTRGECPLDDGMRADILAVNDALASRGLRVLALATGCVRGTDDAGLDDLAFAGLVGMVDPPAPDALETIARLRGAGIRTIMLTGDQRRTADAIARQLGIITGNETTLDGSDVESLAPEALADRVGNVGAFSRVSPAAKLRIVDALRERGEIVAMLGDGVNDAPALRRADVGVAMGGRGSDVAKEAAGVILTDDRFATVAAAVEEGRVISTNIRRFVFYLLSGNVAEIIVVVTAAVADLPTPLSALQLLWLNLITDTLPALALAFEAPDPRVMQRPPRDPRAPLLSRRLLGAALGYAVVIGACSLAAYAWGWSVSGSARNARLATTLCFMTLALGQIAHVGNARHLPGERGHRRVNRFALAAVTITVALQIAAVYLHPLADVLGTSALEAGSLGVVVLLSLVPLAVGAIVRAAAAGRTRTAARRAATGSSA